MRKIGTTRYSYSLTVLSRKVISRHVPIVENYRDTRKVPKPIKHGEDASLVFVFSMTRFACSSSTYGRMGRPDNMVPTYLFYQNYRNAEHATSTISVTTRQPDLQSEGGYLGWPDVSRANAQMLPCKGDRRRHSCAPLPKRSRSATDAKRTDPNIVA